MTESKKWFKCAGVRAIKTIAQTAIATIGTSAVLSAVDWRMVISASILAGILSLLTSLAGIPECAYEEAGDQNGNKEDASDSEQVQQTSDTTKESD